MSGGYIVAGTTKSTDGDISFHHGAIAIQYDYWIVNLDSMGTILWEKTLGGGSNDLAESVIQTTDSGFVIAGRSSSTDGEVTAHHGTTQNSDLWIVKLNTSGILQWQKSLGGTLDDGAYSIQQTLEGGFIVGGNSTSSNGGLTKNNGKSDYWIVKLSSLVNVNEIPNSLLKFEIGPNPFSNKINLSFKHLFSDDVKIEIHSLDGRIIQIFNNLNLGFGVNQFFWDGTSKDGNKVENGIYFISVFSDNICETKKVIVLID